MSLFSLRNVECFTLECFSYVKHSNSERAGAVYSETNRHLLPSLSRPCCAAHPQASFGAMDLCGVKLGPPSIQNPGAGGRSTVSESQHAHAHTNHQKGVWVGLPLQSTAYVRRAVGSGRYYCPGSRKPALLRRLWCWPRLREGLLLLLPIQLVERPRGAPRAQPLELRPGRGRRARGRPRRARLGLRRALCTRAAAPQRQGAAHRAARTRARQHSSFLRVCGGKGRLRQRTPLPLRLRARCGVGFPRQTHTIR